MQYTPIQYFFWLFSGVEISLLKQCPGDYNRQAGIGFTIFMTCLFAALAGGFAAYRFSEGNWIATIVFGIVWGALIFSIDRSMVVTLKKDPTKGQQKFWEPFLTRMVLAGLLAFMISIPLEIEIFKGVIDIQLKEDVENAVDKYGENVKKNAGIADVSTEQLREEKKRREAEANAVAANNKIPGWLSINEEAVSFGRLESNANQKALNARRVKEKALAETYKRRYDPETNEYITYQEKSGKSWNTYLAKLNEERKYLKEAANWRTQKQLKNKEAGELANNYRKQQSKLAAEAKIRENKVTARIDSLQQVIDSKTGEYEEEQADVGFVRQYVAMENAAKRDSGVMFFLWVIRILFFTIEILPTIVKLKTPLGDYDRMLASHEASFALSLENNLQILRSKEQIRRDTELSIATQVEKDRLAQEVDLNRKVLADIADRQQDLAKRLLKEWHQQEKQKLAKPKPTAQPTSCIVPPSIATAPLQPSYALQRAPTMPAAMQGVAVNLPASFTAPTLNHGQAKIANKVWQLQNSQRKEFYVFYDNPVDDMTLERQVDSQPVEEGKWAYDAQDASVININMNGQLENYRIADVTDNFLKLVSTNGIKTLQLNAKAG